MGNNKRKYYNININVPLNKENNENEEIENNENEINNDNIESVIVDKEQNNETFEEIKNEIKTEDEIVEEKNETISENVEKIVEEKIEIQEEIKKEEKPKNTEIKKEINNGNFNSEILEDVKNIANEFPKSMELYKKQKNQYGNISAIAYSKINIILENQLKKYEIKPKNISNLNNYQAFLKQLKIINKLFFDWSINRANITDPSSQITLMEINFFVNVLAEDFSDIEKIVEPIKRYIKK